MIVLTQPTLIDEVRYESDDLSISDYYMLTDAQILFCPSCLSINLLKIQYCSDYVTQSKENGLFYSVPIHQIFRLIDQPLSEENQEELNLEKLQNPHLNNTIQLIEEFIFEPIYKNYLLKLLQELEAAKESKLEFSTRILVGAITEALLSYTFNRKRKQSLSNLIELAKSKNIFSENTKNFVDCLRIYLNTVHYDNFSTKKIRLEYYYLKYYY